MLIIKKVAMTAVIGLLLLSCKKDISGCSTNSSDFQSVYKSQKKSGDGEKETMDTEVHSYSFILSADREICAIGYRSQSDLNNTDYRIQIISTNDSAEVYNGSHQFSSSKISYVNPSMTVQLLADVEYTIRRIQTDWNGNFVNTVGDMARSELSDYPMTEGIMTVTRSDFHDDGQDPSNSYYGLPFIDLILE